MRTRRVARRVPRAAKLTEEPQAFAFNGMVSGNGEALALNPTVAARFQTTLWRAGVAVTALGITASLLYAMPSDFDEGVRIVGAGAVTAGAASSAGGVLGFLFGIPKTVQSDGLDGKAVRYLANTNLEDISDWLTKIIVGVGLVQITRVPMVMERLGQWLAPLFGGNQHSAAFAIVFGCYFAISSFLLLYLWTRSRLRGVLQAADIDVSEKIESALTMREGANAIALSVTERQLTGQTPPTQGELNATIRAATPDWLVQIYRRAEEQRAENWRDRKSVMALTIPVFRGLIANDREERFYRHFGSLAFALKDSVHPNYAEAEKLLTKTIEIRGIERNRGLVRYEWNRAVCRIHLDSQFADGQPTTGEMHELIESDLVVSHRQLPARFFNAGEDESSTVISRWLELNDVLL